MTRPGGGANLIRGGVIVADTRGPDGIIGTADDALGAPNFNTAGGGAANFHFCSTVIDDMIGAVPPRPIAFKHFF